MVAEQLRFEIYSGQLSPGERLLQTDIARRFQVSTTPVREAFANLQSEQLIRLDPHRGAVVAKPNVAELRELFEIRAVLEAHAMTLAVPRLTDEVLDEVEGALDDMAANHDFRARVEPHRRFHSLVFSAVSRPRLESLISDLRVASGLYLSATVASGRSFEVEDRDHRELLVALRQRDVEAAVRLTREHLAVTAEVAARYLEMLGGSSVPPSP